MNTGKLKVALIGATGYSGLELTKLLLRHPRLETPVLLRREVEAAAKDDGRHANLADIFPVLSGNGSYPLQPLSWATLKKQGVDLLFLATPHDVSRELAPQSMEHGIRVIDLSGAWRLKQARHRAIYGFKDEDSITAAELTRKAVYGLPELNSDSIPNATIVANPGCYATSIILALAPLLRAGLVDLEKGIVADSKSGVSGAGKDPTSRTHFVSVANNLSAYNVFTHRHLGEIAEQLQVETDEITFTPHLLPIPRGILSTIYVHLKQPMQPEAVQSAYRDCYRGRRFVRVFQTPRLPEIQFSLNTNFCDVGFCLAADGKRLVIVSCEDNLVKGAAGQAVQNMNLMFGFPEEEGLV